MQEIKSIREQYQQAGALHRNVNLFGFWNNRTFLTKAGEPGMVLAFGGIDYESLDHAQRDLAVKRFEAALRVFDEHTRVSQILAKDYAQLTLPVDHPHPLVQAANELRAQHLAERARDLYEVRVYLVVIREGDGNHLGMAQTRPSGKGGCRETLRQLLGGFQSNAVRKVAAERIEAAAQQLEHRVESFRQQLDDVCTVRVLEAEDAFRVLYHLLNFTGWKRSLASLTSSDTLDLKLAGSDLEAHRTYLRSDDHYLKVLTLKEPPAETWPLILRDLTEIKTTFFAVSEWKPIDHGRARKLIQSRRRHFHNSKTSFLSNLSLQDHKGPADELIDDSKQAAIADLGACLTAISHEGKYFGEFSLSVVLYGEDLREVERAVPQVVRAFSKYDGTLQEERYNLLNAYFATVPGNRDFNLRRLYLLNTNYADLSFLFTVATGEVHNRPLNSEYLAVLETDQATPYYLNLHQHDVAHALILGATGSGKSFLLNFLLQGLQKYSPQTYIFDLGGSFENLTRTFGGSYLEVGASEQEFTINPFALAPEKRNLDFLFAFLRVLIEGHGKYTMSGVEERSLYAAIERIYKLDPATRTLTNFAAMIGSLGEPLQRWTRRGQFGHFFDNVADTLTVRPFQTFNFDATLAPDVIEPLLFYVLHRASHAIDDPAAMGQFKVFVMDEAWLFLRNRTIRDYVTKAEKTWRKRNAAMILATQSLHELAASEMLEIVAESCPTKIFLANPDMNIPLYRDAFHLNDTELELLSSLIPKRDLLVKTPEGAKKLHLSVDAWSYWMATNTPRDNLVRQAYFAKYGAQRGLEHLARDHPFGAGTL
jgi:type IV secretion system protein TrbE